MYNVTVSDVLRAVPVAAEKTLSGAGINSKIRLYMQGDMAAVSWFQHGSTKYVDMVFPLMPLDAPLTRHEADQLAGYWMHEICHVVFTDSKAWEGACKRGPGFSFLVNALEDIRIEQKAIREGLTLNLQKRIEVIMDHAMLENDKSGYDPANVNDLPVTCAMLGRIKVLGYKIPNADYIETALKTKAPFWYGRVMTALDETSQAQNTQDVVEIVERMIQGATTANPQPQPQQGQGQDQNQSQGQGDDQDQGEGQGQDGDQSDDQDQGQSQDDDQKEAKENEKDDKGEQESPGQPIMVPVDLDKLQSAEPNIDHIGQKASSRVKFYDQDGHMRMSSYQGCKTQTVTKREDSYGEYRRAINSPGKLRNDVRRLLRAPEVMGKTHYETSGRLDRRSLVRARAGAADIFSKRFELEGIETDVSLLIDMSGSMDGDRLEMATTLAIHLGEAIESAGGKCEIVGFATYNSGHAIPSANLRIVKSFGQRMRARRQEIAAMPKLHLQYTPLAPAILGAGDRLVKLGRGNRKILFTLTDGACDYGDEAVRVAVKLIEQKGVDVVGVGIMSDVTHLYQHAVNVGCLSELTKEGLGIVADQLGRYHEKRRRVA